MTQVPRRGPAGDTPLLYLCQTPGAMSESDPFHPNGPALDVDGNLVNRLARVEPRGVPSPPPREAPLELPKPPKPSPSRYAVPAETYRQEPVARRSPVAVWIFGIALALGVALLAAVLVVPMSAWLPAVRSFLTSNAFLEGVVSLDRATVVVTSEPPGATVRIAGQVVGTTPWAGDNLWGDTTITVELPGHVPFSAPLGAHHDATLEAKLRPR